MILEIVKRLLYLLGVLIGVSLFTYIVMSSADSRASFAEMGSPIPFFSGYFAWLRDIFFSEGAGFGAGRGGYSSRAALLYFNRIIPGTIRLASASLVLVIAFSIPLGILSAFNKDGIFDYGIRALSFIGASIPNYILAIILMFGFAVKLRWFPVMGSAEPRSFVLPLCSLSLPLISRYMRHIRAATLEELSQDYVIGAIARGVRQWRVMLYHVFPNILPSILSFLVASIGHLLGGVVIIETIFAWRGIGVLVVPAIRQQDIPVIQAYVLWMAIFYIVFSVVIDTISQLLVRQTRRKKAV
ncbi:MAG: ABC transporter permease [Clostridiales bacterium]|nr:ABC transporter permease [Clostridiales bacterium]